LQEQITNSRNIVRQYLTAAGFQDQEISVSPPQIADAETSARSDSEDRKPPAFRYTATVTTLLRSSRVDEVRKAMEASDQLVQSGIALAGGEYNSRAEFIFTGINAIKPGMIEEATMNARKAAEQFAKDSKSNVGSIRRATQGGVEINDRDSSSPHRKIVRIVTTVDYFLE
ncbi:MAG TPA: SIMPL domain-containing protein, partial [Chthoniobacterales bacterium]|nr:SIMPL domain-containing protein [Chthoniobacterales bacterium]